jgi:hypothetical protein
MGFTHGIYKGGSHKHPLQNVYYNILKRCYSPKAQSYKYYGEKGIGVCKRWTGENGFANFVKDMGERPKGYQIDRINNNDGYYPENCRWVNIYQQMANQTSNNEIVGVGWHKQRGKYRARIKVNKKDISLGLFNKLEDAIKARKEAEKIYVPGNHCY